MATSLALLIGFNDNLNSYKILPKRHQLVPSSAMAQVTLGIYFFREFENRDLKNRVFLTFNPIIKII